MVTVNVDVNVVLELIFYVFCHDHGVVEVVSAGMKIYVFCHHHVVVNGIRKQILKK